MSFFKSLINLFDIRFTFLISTFHTRLVIIVLGKDTISPVFDNRKRGDKYIEYTVRPQTL